MQLIDIIGALAAFLTTASFLPQVIKTLRDRDTKGISLLMYVCFVSGVFLWMVFGLLLEKMVLVIANFITFILAGAVLVIKLRNLKNERK